MLILSKDHIGLLNRLERTIQTLENPLAIILISKSRCGTEEAPHFPEIYCFAWLINMLSNKESNLEEYSSLG